MNNNQVVGTRPVIELLQSEKEVDKILISREFSSPEILEISALAKKKGIPVQRVPKVKLDRESKINHQGVMAFISPIPYVSIDDILQIALDKNQPPFVLLLDSVTDTRNFGAICRTAECMGVHGIIIPTKNRAAITEGVIKSSAGAVFNVKISKINHLLDAVYHLQASDVEVLSISEKATITVRNHTPSKKGLAVILGSEDLGIHPKIISASDNHLKIEMYGDIESLNVGVAGGIVMYELKNSLDKIT